MNIQEPTEKPVVKEKIKENISYLKNTNLEPKASEIMTFLNNDIIINTFNDGFKSVFIDNFKKITENINIFISWWNLDNDNELLLSNIWEIHAEAIKTSKNIYNDLFKDFLPKSHTDKNWDKNIKQLWRIAFLNKDFYVNNSSKQWFDIMNSLYLLSVNYLISYNIWLRKVTQNFSKTINTEKSLDKENQDAVQEIMNSIQTSSTLEDTALRNLLFTMSLKLDKKIFKSITENLKWWRLKTIESSIKKLLKSPKYRNQFQKEWILWDQLWFLIKYNSFDEIEKIATEIFVKSKEADSFVWKFNDRWIVEKNSTNKDTIAEHPFVNTWFIIDNTPLWEISLRYDNSDLIEKILKEDNLNKKLLFKDLVINIDTLNHEIYKLSQDIKITRNIFIDNKEIRKWTNFNKSVWIYLVEKTDTICENIKKWICEILNKNNIEYGNTAEDDNCIKEIVLTILEDKVYKVIKDIAWEWTLSEIKNTNQYKNKNDTDKRSYLKRISKTFEQNLELRQKTKFWNYSEEIKKIFKTYKKEYNLILKDAFFLKKIKDELKITKNILNVTSETKSQIIKKIQ